MSKIIIVLLTLGSMSANAAEDCSVKLDSSSPRLEKRVTRILQKKGYTITDKEAAFELKISVGDADGSYSQSVLGDFMIFDLPYHYAWSEVTFSKNGEKKIDTDYSQGTLFINAKPIFKAKALSDVRNIPNCDEFYP